MIKAFSNKSIRTFVILAVSLSFFGFTRIVGFCSMSMTDFCCCGNDGTSEAPASQGGHALASLGNSCYSVRMIGGLNETKAIVASEHVSKLGLITPILDLSPVPDVNHPRQATTLRHFFVDYSPPPNHDICIQVHSLLI